MLEFNRKIMTRTFFPFITSMTCLDHNDINLGSMHEVQFTEIISIKYLKPNQYFTYASSEKQEGLNKMIT